MHKKTKKLRSRQALCACSAHRRRKLQTSIYRPVASNMENLASKLVDWTRLTVLIICCSYCGGNYMKTYSYDKSVNFLKVLNTSEPLFLFLWKPKIPPNRTCKGYDCMNRTVTCEHMRKMELDKYEYNHTVSKLTTNGTWFNETLNGRFVGYTGSPTKMNVYNTRPPHPRMYCVTLLYNQPDTYNCSVMLISEDISGTCANQNEETLATAKCAMYIRGKLPPRTYPPVACHIPFNKCSNSRITYMPYSSTCPVN